jgi:hypothetical protein
VDTVVVESVFVTASVVTVAADLPDLLVIFSLIDVCACVCVSNNANLVEAMAVLAASLIEARRLD